MEAEYSKARTRAKSSTFVDCATPCARFPGHQRVVGYLYRAEKAGHAGEFRGILAMGEVLRCVWSRIFSTT